VVCNTWMLNIPVVLNLSLKCYLFIYLSIYLFMSTVISHLWWWLIYLLYVVIDFYDSIVNVWVCVILWPTVSLKSKNFIFHKNSSVSYCIVWWRSLLSDWYIYFCFTDLTFQNYSKISFYLVIQIGQLLDNSKVTKQFTWTSDHISCWKVWK